MLDNCIEIFRKSDMLKQVLDGYVPADGDYLIYEWNSGNFQLKKHLKVKQDKKTREIGISPKERRELAELDYYCKLLEMNKPIDQKKVIHSNNYLSFWIKKENLDSGKLTDEIIDKYYDILSTPTIKYSKMQDRMLYESAELKLGEINQIALQTVKEWIKENLTKLPIEISGKDYLKLFFLMPDTDIKTEGERYLIPNLFNKNDYNQKIGEEIFGVPNNNMQMNAKKPFLEYKDRLQKVPMLESTAQVLDKKLFFDYLLNCAANGKYNIYLYSEQEDEENYKIRAYGNKELPAIYDGQGYFLRIRKGKNEAEIEQMDGINCYRNKLKKPINVQNITDINTEKAQYPLYTKYTTLEKVSEMIDFVYFSKFLAGNYFTEPSEITNLNGKKKQYLVQARTAFFNWFYKGNDKLVRSIWDKLSRNIICCSIENGNMAAANNQFNVWIAVGEYFKGGDNYMADVMKSIRESIRTKINAKEYQSFEKDEEYYYAVGQLAAYFISKNKAKKKNHATFNAFLNIQKDELLKNKLQILFKKYNYDIETNSMRFNQMYNMIASYEPEGEKALEQYMIAGYISNNLIYEKGEKKDEK